MQVDDFNTHTEVNSAADLELALRQRSASNANHFWLCPENDKHPSMSLAVKNDLAYLHYFPFEGHPGFRSVGAMRQFKPDDMISFPISALGDDIHVLGDAVIPFSIALNAAKEFLETTSMPKAVEWFEL